MRYRLLGGTGLRVSELFLGTMAFGGTGADSAESRRIVDAYADAGGNVLDTAVTYQGGQGEAILGEILQGRRDRFVLATKYTVSRDTSDPNAAGNHRKNLVRSLETSLRRLRTDVIDLYWVHMWDRYTPIDETMRALDDAVRAGKILYAGISDAPAWVVARANTLAEERGLTRFSAVQVPYNLLDRDVERDLLPMAENLGLTAATWSPLGHGVLIGRKKGPDELPPDRAAAVRALADVAGEIGATPAQVALAWTRARSRCVHPIVGASTLEQITDDLGAVDVTLPGDALTRLNDVADFRPGFPGDFLERAEPGVLGAAITGLDRP
ncbi:aldo/keto reductase [Actinomadura flavalba]|uniref:aldo/keto reductase n=1 Tax=Actinomadura flavalba TaxID=1120938 RepID=UPI00036EB0FE|nr:aldo/keto reductase [Actinomadura flavalba]